MNDGGFVALRPEARPMRREALNESQLTAMKAVVAALKEAVSQVQPSDEREKADGFIDTDRVSRLFFGFRSAGKRQDQHLRHTACPSG